MRVADGGPAAAADVHRAGRVGGDELQVQPLPGERVGAAVGLPRRDRPDGDLPEGVGGEGDVEEAGAGDVDPGDALVAAQLLGDQLGDLAGRPPGRLGQPQRHVGGVVAVLGVLRALDDDLVGDGDGERTAVDDRRHGGADHVAELLGCHRVIVRGAAPPAVASPAAPGSAPRLAAGPPGGPRGGPPGDED